MIPLMMFKWMIQKTDSCDKEKPMKRLSIMAALLIAASLLTGCCMPNPNP